MNKEITKKPFWHYVNLKIKRSVHTYHVYSVISILFDELIKDLIAGKKINVVNFGTLSLERTKPRKYCDINLKKVVLSKGARNLKFSLSRKLKNKLIKNLDLDFMEEND